MRFLACSVVYLHVCIHTHMLISFIKGKVQLEDLLHHLEKEGIELLAFTEEQLYFVWCLLQQRQAEDCYQKSRRAVREAHGRN